MEHTTPRPLKFFTFRQNNSFGEFEINEKVGDTVIIEAANAEEANSIAEDLGIYFNGVQNEIDCECCGDRWSSVDDRDGVEILDLGDLYAGTYIYTDHGKTLTKYDDTTTIITP